MEKKLAELKQRLLEVSDLNAAAAVLGWDQQVFMPPQGAASRGRHMATLAKIAQEKAIDPTIGRLLDDLQPYAESLDRDSDDARYIRVARRAYDKAVKIPPALVAELNENAAVSYGAWTEARPKNDFAATLPYLEKTLDISRRLADCFPGYEHIADPLIDFSDYGMKASSVRTIFAELREQLVPLVQAITSQEPTDDSCLLRKYPEKDQQAFGEKVIQDFGYDFQRGRQDKTHHPFATKFAWGDVRITTRFKENNLGDGLFSTLHESGHAMYEQGVRPELEGGSLDGGTSSGVHESQSRLWENIVGRSLPFWEYYYPQLQTTFPTQLGNVSLDTFYRAINKVQRSLIRTDADEVTYNLHVMIRFDLEMQLLDGSLALRDLPETWHTRYQSDLGLCAPDDRDGVLQDVHWYSGMIGGLFQGYTLGNIMSGLFFSQALQAHPEIMTEIGQGRFGTLHNWLTKNIYQHGSKYTADELIRRVTGGPLTIAPYMAYLRTKFGALYDLT